MSAAVDGIRAAFRIMEEYKTRVSNYQSENKD